MRSLAVACIVTGILFTLDIASAQKGTGIDPEALIEQILMVENRQYQQITDIFAECSIDYDSNSEITKNFYAMMGLLQNE